MPSRWLSRTLVLLLIMSFCVILPSHSSAAHSPAAPAVVALPQPRQIAKEQTQAAPVVGPITSTFSQGTDAKMGFGRVGFLAQGRVAHTMTELPNGDVLILGGNMISATEELQIPLATAERFNLTTATQSNAGQSATTRVLASMTVLPSGEVLIAGGGDSLLAEIYTRATNQWRLTGSLHGARSAHTATVLTNGKILLAGGTSTITVSAELYDPSTGTFTLTGPMIHGRWGHHALRLPNGKVMVVGGGNPNEGEIYDPATEQWTALPLPIPGNFLGLQGDGKVLIGNEYLQTYDPATGTFTSLGIKIIRDAFDMRPVADNRFVFLAPSWHITAGSGFYMQTYSPVSTYLQPFRGEPYDWSVVDGGAAVLTLADGRMIASGGYANGRWRYMINDITVGNFVPPDVMAVSITYPGVQLMRWSDPWVIQASVPLQFHIVSEPRNLTSVRIDLDNGILSDWLPWTAGQLISITMEVNEADTERSIAVTLRDDQGGETPLNIVTIKTDLIGPVVTPPNLAVTRSSPLLLEWSGTAHAGITGYDLDMRPSTSNIWTPMLTNTLMSSTLWHAPAIGNYVFRIRALDQLGQISSWTEATATITDLLAAPSLIIMNGGAQATIDPTVTIGIAVHQIMPKATHLRLSDDGLTWPDWQPATGRITHTLTGPGIKSVYLELRYYDRWEGYLTTPTLISSIRLDPAAGSSVQPVINAGRRFTNDPMLNLGTGGPVGATHMQLSTTTDFANLVWLPFDTQSRQRLTLSPGITTTVWLRVRNADGTLTSPASTTITYDPFPPTGSLTVLEQTATSLHLALNASDPDNISGLAGMRVGTPEQFAAASWEPFAPEKTLAVSSTDPLQPVYAQFRDAANNTTPILCATLRATACGLTPRVNLPLIGQ